MFDLPAVVANDEVLCEPEGVGEPPNGLVGVFIAKGWNKGLVAGHLYGLRSRRAASYWRALQKTREFVDCPCRRQTRARTTEGR